MTDTRTWLDEADAGSTGPGLSALIESRRSWVDVSLLVLLAAALRLTTLGLQSFEFDEGATLYVIRGSFSHTLHGVARYESTPPLYYVLAWAWSQVFGTGETGLRLLSGLAGVATVAVVYTVGCTLASRRIGLVAGAIVATSPYLVFYSQEARAYAVLVLCTSTATLFCARAIRRRGRRDLVWWAAWSIAAIATHYFAVFAVAGQVVALAVYGVPRRAVIRATAAVAVACSPLILLARHQAGAGHTSWISAQGLGQRVRVTTETFALGATFRGSLSHSLLVVFGVLAVVVGAGIAIGVALLARRAAADERRAASVAGVIAAVAIVVPLVGALGPGDYFLHKNVSPALPLLALVLACGLACRRAGRIGLAATTGVVTAGLALTVLSFASASLRRPDIRQVSEWLGAPARERIVVFVPRWGILLQQYQGPLPNLPAEGRRVSEIDVFTSSASLPDGTVPTTFRLVREQRGDTFNLFTFRASSPQLVTPAEIAQRTFSESGLQPIATIQSPRG